MLKFSKVEILAKNIYSNDLKSKHQKSVTYHLDVEQYSR